MPEIWEEVIPSRTAYQFTIVTNSDFFHVGGNPLMLIQLQKHIENQTGINLPLMALFKSSTLGANTKSFSILLITERPTKY